MFILHVPPLSAAEEATQDEVDPASHALATARRVSRPAGQSTLSGLLVSVIGGLGLSVTIRTAGDLGTRVPGMPTPDAPGNQLRGSRGGACSGANQVLTGRHQEGRFAGVLPGEAAFSRYAQKYSNLRPHTRRQHRHDPDPITCRDRSGSGDTKANLRGAVRLLGAEQRPARRAADRVGYSGSVCSWSWSPSRSRLCSSHSASSSARRSQIHSW